MREGCDATAAAHHNRLLPLHRHFLFQIVFFSLLYGEFVGGGLVLVACFTVLCLICRLRFFHVMLRRLMGCLPFFLRPAVSLVWLWRQQWDSVAACSSHVSHLPLLLPRCVGGEEAGDCVGGVAPQWEK
ncbi:hypothetical protein TcCL_NonESM09448 [Trypanosoma cruzi]|nr:hypothetical protein TcCL_NonESM09448 [Trypanosoma cruzi]